MDPTSLLEVTTEHLAFLTKVAAKSALDSPAMATILATASSVVMAPFLLPFSKKARCVHGAVRLSGDILLAALPPTTTEGVPSAAVAGVLMTPSKPAETPLSVNTLA